MRTETKPETASAPETRTKTEQAQHSPLPWKLLDGAILSENVNDYGNFIIVESPRRYADETTEQDRANMRQIVASVNHAEALALALREVELRTTQARIASGIGKRKNQAEFLLGELERIAGAAREALARWEGAK